MKLFGNRHITVTGIHSAIHYRSTEASERHKEYSPALRCHELIFKLSGKAEVEFSGEHMSEKAGSVRFLCAGEHDGRYIVDSTEPGDCIDVYFMCREEMPSPCALADFPDSAPLRSLFIKLQKTWVLRSEGYYNECMSLLYAIFAQLEKEEARYLPGKSYEKIRPGIEYIEKNCFESGFDYAAPAAVCGISESYFKRLFVRKYGVPPSRYVTSLRMRYAGELLATGRYSVTECAFAVGYNSVYYFSRAFKKETGMAPTAFAASKAKEP